MANIYETSSMEVIGSNYIKYDRLQEITNTVFAGSDAEECNIFIDLYSVLSKLYKTNYNPAHDDNYTDIAAGIINMIAHYRRFYWSKYGVKTKFYLIYSENINRQSLLMYPQYNKSMVDHVIHKSYIRKAITENLGFVNEMCKYITDCVFINSTYEVSTIIYYYILKHNNTIPNIIITKDELCMQVLAMPNTVVFRPKKSQSNDISYFVTGLNNGIYKHYFSDNKIKVPDILNMVNISPALYTLLLAMSKCSSRNIKSLISAPSALSVITDAIIKDNRLNTYSYTFMDNIISKITNDKTRETLMHGYLLERFKAIDMCYQYGLLLNSPEIVSFIEPMNLYDPEGFHHITNEYFPNAALKLQDL